MLVSYKEGELLLRGGASTRFQPKRRASTDHNPGPNIASAPPMVAKKRQAQRSPAPIRTFPNPIKAMSVPAIGVHRPGIRRIPDPVRNAAIKVRWVGGLLHKMELSRTTSADPPTTRMSSNPMPGQPPANVEYRRRKDTSFQLIACDIARQITAPKRVMFVTL